MLNNTQNKDKDRCIIFVVYRKLYHTTVDIRDDAPIKRKLSLENRNIYSPLSFISAMGLIKSKGNNDFSTPMKIIWFVSFITVTTIRL